MAFEQAELAEFVLESFAERTATPSLRQNEISLIGFRDTEPSAGVKWLLERGEDFRDSGDPLYRLSEDVRENRREATARYRKTSQGRKALKELKARHWAKVKDEVNAARRARRAAQ